MEGEENGKWKEDHKEMAMLYVYEGKEEEEEKKAEADGLIAGRKPIRVFAFCAEKLQRRSCRLPFCLVSAFRNFSARFCAKVNDGHSALDSAAVAAAHLCWRPVERDGAPRPQPERDPLKGRSLSERARKQKRRRGEEEQHGLH